MPSIDEQSLKSILATNHSRALGSETTKLSQDRRDALSRYRGDPIGNEQDGQSKVVMTDTQDIVESVLPSILRIFLSSGRLVDFEPANEEDEDYADQASDYVNYVFNRDNDGFGVLYTAIKDALLMRTGYIKVYWDSGEYEVVEDIEGIDDDQLTLLQDDKNVTITQNSNRVVTVELAGGVGEELGGLQEEVVVHDVKIKRILNKGGRAVVEAIPPEEIIFDPEATNLNDFYCAHVTFRTESELMSQIDDYDVSKKELGLVASSSGDLFTTDKDTRFAVDGGYTQSIGETEDRTTRLIRVTEHYINMDWDGDGIAERRMITTFGDENDVIAQNVELLDGTPIIDFAAIRMPHKIIGRSLDDLVADLGEVKTAIVRQTLNNFYQSNYPQRVVDPTKVEIDDLLSPSPNGIIRGDPSAYLQLPPTTLGSSPFNLLEFVESVKENRTGITRTNQGLEADTLNKTATGISLLLSASQQRQELMVRLFAESVKRLAKLLLSLTCRHQDIARTVRLRNKWVSVDPRNWDKGMDATISVGLGSGNKEQQIGALLNIKQLQTEAMQIQGSADGALVDSQGIYNTYSRIVEVSGFQNPEDFFNDPESDEQQTIAQLQQQLQQMQAQMQQLQQVSQQGQVPTLPNGQAIPQEALAQAQQELEQEGAFNG